ncbi:MAG: glycosyltransferase family 2 protein, partial [Verrucomicrobiaceae bacterium]
MFTLALAITFWLSGLALFFTFLGYRYFIALLSRVAPFPEPDQNGTLEPTVTAVLVASNEEDRIIARIENLLAAEYPPEKLRVLLVSDGST